MKCTSILQIVYKPAKNKCGLKRPAGLGAVTVCAVAVLSGCMSTGTTGFDVQREVTARVGNADCSALRENMRQAIASLNEAKRKRTTGGLASGAGMAMGLIPGGAIISAVATGVGISKRTSGIQGTVEPELLYRASHDAYQKKGCRPAIPFGE